MSPRPAIVLAVLCALLGAACLEVSDREPPMCKTTADCDAGEICEENVCWGNPPMGPIAAVVLPSSERSADLVSREVLMLPIAGDGWIEELHLDTGVTFQGRLQTMCDPACNSQMTGATLTVTRPSIFPGGPGFSKVVTIDDDTFELNVPVTGPNDPLFTITVVPGGRDLPGSGTSTIAQQVPPLYLQRGITGTMTGQILEMGGVTLPKLTGRVTTNLGAGLAGYRVVAYGRWAPDQPPTEVSSVDFTGSDGLYELRLSARLMGNVEIVARPIGAQLRPELRLTGVSGQQSSTNQVLAIPEQIGVEQAVTVTVDHKDTGGEIAPVAGARVIIAGAVEESTTTARVIAEAITDEGGAAHLKLLPGARLSRSYRMSIIPPTGSKAAAVFDKPYDPQQQTISQRLGTRFAITGEVHGADGEPLEGVSVTARPSVRFVWNLDAASQAFLGEIPAATTATTANGEFVLFVDHALPSGRDGQLTTVWGYYDLELEPTIKSRMPSWTWAGLELPRDDAQSTRALGVVQLPDAAYVRGIVFDDENARLEDAEVKLYRVQTDFSVCQDTRFEPLSCPIPPVLLGRATSDEHGVTRLTLPRLPELAP